MERYSLKALAQELNSRYNDKGVDVFVEMKSYEDFKDKQTEYNKYISKNADMALFVLDGSIGKFTRNELVTAANAYKLKQSPEIVVFLKNFAEETEGIRNILDLLADLFGEHFFYVNYDNASDLKFKAETRISRFISPTDYIRSVKRWRIGVIAFIFVLVALSGLITVIIGKNKDYNWKTNEPILLFMGGGSVAKYIEAHYNFKIDNIPNLRNTIYMGVPTGTLWHMLGEEYYKCDSIRYQRSYPVFLAANAVNMNDVASAILDRASMTQNMYVMELHLGRDTIKTYVGPGFDTKKIRYQTINHSRKIYCQDSIQLKSLIEYAFRNNVLYTTTPKSGTLKAYQEVLGSSLNLVDMVEKDSVKHKVYNERISLRNTRSDYVLLGSDHYYPKAMPSNLLHTNNARSLYVIDKNDSILYKNLYIYFVAYADLDKGIYCIPSQIMNFLDIISQSHPIQNFQNIIGRRDDDGWGIVDEKIIKEHNIDGLIKLKMSE